GPDRYRLVITMHHIVLDGWSLPLLFGELSEVSRRTIGSNGPHGTGGSRLRVTTRTSRHGACSTLSGPR
ncbi:hypothetical protein ACWD6I_29310, partial [Streptomyces sp. NPDC002454]